MTRLKELNNVRVVERYSQVLTILDLAGWSKNVNLMERHADSRRFIVGYIAVLKVEKSEYLSLIIPDKWTSTKPLFVV